MSDPFNLKKRGKFWVPDFTLEGVRVHRSTKCVMKAEAVERCEVWAQEIRNQVDGIEPPEPLPTLSKALAEWETANRGVLSDKHVDGTGDKIRLHFAELLDVPLDGLSTKLVEQARTTYLNTPGPTGRTHKAGGANSLVKALNTVMGWAADRWAVPARPYKLRKVREERVPRRVVPLADTGAFLAAVDAPYKGTAKKHSPKAKPKNPHVLMCIRMMLGLGLREKEALASRWEWIDATNRTYYAGKTKNGTVRLIPMPRWLLAHLGPTTGKEGLILPQDGDTPHEGQFTKKVLQEVGRALGLPGLTPHRLRATFATNHARAGTPIPTIQVWLGHERIETTMIYIEFMDDGGHQAQDKIEAMMGLAPVEPELDPPKNTQNSSAENPTKTI